ncbi:MAG: GNAT family N-acetyltransferase [Haloechinothrix sp.]
MTLYANPSTRKSTIVRFIDEAFPAEAGELTPEWGRLRNARRKRRPVIRALRPTDVHLVHAMSAELSAHSLAQRFFVGTPAIPRALLRQLAAVDHGQNEAIIAVVGGRAIGLAQYVRLAYPTRAELAVIVVDAWQRNGIGRMLVTHLAELAAARGITRFEASVLPDNEPARRAVARGWPGAAGTESEDSVDYDLPLSRHCRPGPLVFGP